MISRCAKNGKNLTKSQKNSSKVPQADAQMQPSHPAPTAPTSGVSAANFSATTAEPTSTTTPSVTPRTKTNGGNLSRLHVLVRDRLMQWRAHLPEAESCFCSGESFRRYIRRRFIIMRIFGVLISKRICGIGLRPRLDRVRGPGIGALFDISFPVAAVLIVHALGWRCGSTLLSCLEDSTILESRVRTRLASICPRSLVLNIPTARYHNDLWVFDTQEYVWKQIEFKETELKPSYVDALSPCYLCMLTSLDHVSLIDSTKGLAAASPSSQRRMGLFYTAGTAKNTKRARGRLVLCWKIPGSSSMDSVSSSTFH